MNVRRLLQLAAAFAAVAAAAVVCVVAAAFAVYALARAWIGPAGGAAVVAGLFAAGAVALAWRLTRKAAPAPSPATPAQDQGLTERLLQMAKDRPLVALGAVAAAATVLIRNPAMLTALSGLLTASRASAKPEA